MLWYCMQLVGVFDRFELVEGKKSLNAELIIGIKAHGCFNCIVYVDISL